LGDIELVTLTNHNVTILVKERKKPRVALWLTNVINVMAFFFSLSQGL